MGKRTYTGLNIQFPISRLILSGEKTIETRTYPIPKKLIGLEMAIVETPGKKGRFKSRVVGTIIFGESFKYQTEKSFYSDSKKHCVTPNSDWAWNSQKSKWGWPILFVKTIKKPKPLLKRPGIIYCLNVTI